MGFFSFLFWAIIIFLIVRLLRKPEPAGNWNHLFPNMQFDPEEFYKLVEENLAEWEIQNVRTGRRIFKQGSIISHQRVYLEIAGGDYVYHVCAAPYGTGFFFSWWLRRWSNDPMERLITRLPFFGPIIAQLMNLTTYYRMDTDSMFRACVEQSIQTAVDHITETKGIRALTETERKPDLRAAFK
jgi:hypothetical protein